MGREVRRVPATWEHPKDEQGRFIPMHQTYTDYTDYTEGEIEEGLREGWLKGEPPFYGQAVMPQWPEAERTHYQMYEDCTEGTPISPPMETPEALARWLADTGASSFGGMTASYEAWLRVCRGGWAPSCVIAGGRLESGVSFDPGAGGRP
jgi:hypothetical protein